MGDEGSVVGEEEVTEQLLKCLCVGLQSSEANQTAVKAIADVHSTVIIEVLCGLFKHHSEKDAKQSRFQDTTLFHAVDDGEGSG